MTESILNSVKKMLGITEEYTHFDADIIMHINSVFSILTQLGVGPDTGFMIEDDSTNWGDYIPEETGSALLSMVRTYMFMKVKMMFDPPLSSSVADAYNRQISELEWRLNVAVETELPEVNASYFVNSYGINLVAGS